MNQTRSFLLIAWLVVASLLYMEWSRDPAPAAPAAATATATPALPAAAGTLPSVTHVPSDVPSATAAAPGAAPGAVPESAAVAPITVDTDVLHLEIDPRGGTLVGADLLAYPVDKDAPARKVRLLDTAGSTYSVAQSGLLAVGGGTAPTHDALYRTEGDRRAYRLAD